MVAVVILLIFLDLLAMFNTINQNILLGCSMVLVEPLQRFHSFQMGCLWKMMLENCHHHVGVLSHLVPYAIQIICHRGSAMLHKHETMEEIIWNFHQLFWKEVSLHSLFAETLPL